MNESVIPLLDLVLVGGGHSHVHVMKMMGMNPIPGVRITLITKDVETPYSGMLPGYVAGYYTSEECHIDLGKLSSFARIRLFHAEVYHIDTKLKRIHCRGGRPPVSYDILSINIGIVPRPLDSTSFTIHSNVAMKDIGNITPVKPIDKFALRWELILSRLLQRSFTETFTIAIVGGGAGGVELCFAVFQRLKTHLQSKNIDSSFLKVILLNRGSTIMAGHCSAARNIINRLLTEKGIHVYNDTDICARDAESSMLLALDGRTFYADEVFWCTQAVGHPWLKESGLDCDDDGFIRVQATLESTNVKNVFASGDICCNVAYPRPKAGVFAVRAGPPLYGNLCRAIRREALEDWVPQSQFLGIIGTGDGYAVASKAGMGIEGAHLWQLKDRIDRDWMRGYQELPTMEEMAASMRLKKMQQQQQQLDKDKGKGVTGGALSGASQHTADGIPELALRMGADTIAMLSKAKMRCGGCGSKVGAQVLSTALKRVRHLMAHRRTEVISGLGDDAALVRPPLPPAYLVQSIDYFRSFISDPYVMGQIAVNHALSDVYAMNGEAVTALALCILPYGPEHMVEDELVQMLAGALKMLSEANCALVGGHTSEGTESALGFSVTGVVHPSQAIGKGPLRPDTALILTKPLGTGTVLAADMRGQAKGRWVSAAIASMLQPNRVAASILHAHGCNACTDVTGFGLLGHLIEMIQYHPDALFDADETADDADASAVVDNESGEVAVELYVNTVPTLLGATDCIQAGILSSLQPQNMRCARAVANVEFGAGNPVYPLLFDPQTSGGLLAAVPLDRAEEAVAALKAAGYPETAVVGKVVARPEKGEFAPLVYLLNKE